MGRYHILFKRQSGVDEVSGFATLRDPDDGSCHINRHGTHAR